MSEPLLLAEEVRGAHDAGRPIVALETSVLSHGLPEPFALRAAGAMDAEIRARGAVPAWVWTDGGSVRVGADSGELARLVREPAAKVARRDLPAVVAREQLGGTTVSATVAVAALARIQVAATGGIGGVHRGGEDVSADLLELSRQPVALVCSGPKSILDPAATIDRLEELGVALLGYRCDCLPFFLVREVPLPLEHRVDDPAEAVAVIRARDALGTQAATLVCNPIPPKSALPAEEVAEAVEACLSRAEVEGIRGKALTPFLLGCLGERTGGASIRANLALLVSNASLAGELAVELSRQTSDG
jgi:pseudouridine-5'-phosphate glycosidase